jgi:hypothetical protein
MCLPSIGASSHSLADRSVWSLTALYIGLDESEVTKNALCSRVVALYAHMIQCNAPLTHQGDLFSHLEKYHSLCSLSLTIRIELGIPSELTSTLTKLCLKKLRVNLKSTGVCERDQICFTALIQQAGLLPSLQVLEFFDYELHAHLQSICNPCKS